MDKCLSCILSNFVLINSNLIMNNLERKPNYIFVSSWEVCNKVGGIYTVLSTQAKSFQERMGANLIYIGPDLHKNKENALFDEDTALFSNWQKRAWESEGISVRVGRWRIPGSPIVLLVDFLPFFAMKNWIYGRAWELFSVDSLHSYGDYDEASMFSYASAMTVKSFYRFFLNSNDTVIYHAHEWMTGLGAMFLKYSIPEISTVFTTHATSVGRSIAGNNKPLYDYFEGYNGDQMARELNIESKHSVEKQTAHRVDCFTTVSEITARECNQLLELNPDVLTINGFEDSFLPSEGKFETKRKDARKKILSVANKLMGMSWKDDTIIIGTGGRYEFRNKGLDLFIDSMSKLREDERLKDKHILALINVPGWISEPRKDLQERLMIYHHSSKPLPFPLTTHWLHNMSDDRVIQSFNYLDFRNEMQDHVKVMFVPCYLDGNDGIFDLSYYDLLIGQDLAIFPSYYEPWGYTPLESAAFHVPTITTDLAGFGLWVRSLADNKGDLRDGVKVIHRSDRNYSDATVEIVNTVLQWASYNDKEKSDICSSASKLAEKALWKYFIVNYEDAYKYAVEKTWSHKK